MVNTRLSDIDFFCNCFYYSKFDRRLILTINMYIYNLTYITFV